MRPSVFLVFCVLSCFCSKFVLCEVAGQEGTNLNSPQCLDIDMQVEKTSEDIQTVTEKIKRYYDGIQISLDYNSSVDSSADTSTSTALHWITWPFKSLTHKVAIVYNFWADKTMKVLHWIAWPFRILSNKLVAAYGFLADVCSALKEKVKKQFDDPIKIIEAVLEVIWMVVSPFLRAVIWLCENIIDAKRYIKNGQAHRKEPPLEHTE
ncbi:uncharacterized protein LOC144657447 [Oculina patagonica]